MKTVDVAMCVFGKPYQTAVTLATLFEHSGAHIDRVYVQEEPKQSFSQGTLPVAALFDDRNIVLHRPEFSIGYDFADKTRLTDDAYRTSLRYQYAWEQSGKDFLFLTHNDCVYTADIVGGMLDRLADGSYTGVGQIGQCWNCPAAYAGVCNGDIYETYKPSYEQVLELVQQYPSPRTGVAQIDRNFPTPLPECRLNEFACLIHTARIRDQIIPFGDIVPFGSIFIDCGTEWFRFLVIRGHRFLNWHEGLSHAFFSDDRSSGSAADINLAMYESAETRAKAFLETRYPECAARLERLLHSIE